MYVNKVDMVFLSTKTHFNFEPLSQVEVHYSFWCWYNVKSLFNTFFFWLWVEIGAGKHYFLSTIISFSN